jgi:PEP-CTERM motif
MSTIKSLVITALLLAPTFVRGATLYDSTPASLPPSVPGQSFGAGSIIEFGELVQLTSPALLNSATVVFSTWAPHSQFLTFGDASGYTETLTLNIYDVDNSGATPEPGALLGTMTQSALIPWRAESDVSCGSGANPYGLWKAPDNNCYNGLAFSVNFTLPSTLVGSQLIWGLAFNTHAAGTPAFPVAGPYDALNIGILLGSPSVGSDPLPDTAYLNSTVGAFYADHGAGGSGTFRQDQNWTGNVGMISLQGTGVPEPSSMMMIGAGLLALGCLSRRSVRSLR